MSLSTLYKEGNFTAIYSYLMNSFTTYSSIKKALLEMQILQDNIETIIKKLKIYVQNIDSSNKETIFLKNLSKVFSLLSTLQSIDPHLLNFINEKSNFEFRALNFTAIKISDKTDLLMTAINKDTNFSEYLNNLLQTTKDISKYQFLYPLMDSFRTDMSGNVRNSMGYYKTEIAINNLDKTRSNILLNKENLFIIENKDYKKLNNETKALVEENKSIVESSFYFISYESIEINIAKKDDWLKNNDDFKNWVKKMKKSKQREVIHSELEKVILCLHESSKEVFGFDNYLGYKLSYNKIIKNENDINVLYDYIMLKSLKGFSGEVIDSVDNRIDYFNNKGESYLKKINKYVIEEKELFIKKIINNSLTTIAEEIEFSFKNLSKIKTSNNILYLYELNLLNKNRNKINLFINILNNEQEVLNESMMIAPLFSKKDTLPPAYWINVSIPKEKCLKEIFDIPSLKIFFHELGHIFHMITSNFVNISISPMESVEIPATFMAEYLTEKNNLEKIIGKIFTEEHYSYIKSYYDLEKDAFFLRGLIDGYVYNMLLSKVTKKGDFKNVKREIEEKILDYGILLDEYNLFYDYLNVNKWSFSYTKFDYINTNFTYLLGYIVTDNLRKNEINPKKAFTNLFKYDIIKNDQLYWSKYVDF